MQDVAWKNPSWEFEHADVPLALGVPTPVLLAFPPWLETEIYKMRLDLDASRLQEETLCVMSPSEFLVCVRFAKERSAQFYLSSFKVLVQLKEMRRAEKTRDDPIFGPAPYSPRGWISDQQTDVLIFAAPVADADELFSTVREILPIKVAPVLDRFATRLQELIQEHQLIPRIVTLGSTQEEKNATCPTARTTNE